MSVRIYPSLYHLNRSIFSFLYMGKIVLSNIAKPSTALCHSKSWKSKPNNCLVDKIVITTNGWCLSDMHILYLLRNHQILVFKFLLGMSTKDKVKTQYMCHLDLLLIFIKMKVCYSQFNFHVLDYCQWLRMCDDLSIHDCIINKLNYGYYTCALVWPSTSGNFGP